MGASRSHSSSVSFRNRSTSRHMRISDSTLNRCSLSPSAATWASCAMADAALALAASRLSRRMIWWACSTDKGSYWRRVQGTPSSRA
eukprot:scaffold88821_cov14-Prasinocladus_malaysianus.AAC.2